MEERNLRKVMIGTVSSPSSVGFLNELNSKSIMSYY